MRIPVGADAVRETGTTVLTYRTVILEAVTGVLQLATTEGISRAPLDLESRRTHNRHLK